jgi:hypothetical protein
MGCVNLPEILQGSSHMRIPKRFGINTFARKTKVSLATGEKHPPWDSEHTVCVDRMRTNLAVTTSDAPMHVISTDVLDPIPPKTPLGPPG